MQKYLSTKRLVYAVYSFVIVIVLIAWLQSRSWSFSGFRPYQLFSLIGLTAFVTMLTHYIAGFIYRLHDKEQTDLKQFHKVTALIVFACILLHPVLIILNLKALGFGVPPASYKAFYGQALLPYILLRMVTWLSFIAFEFKENFSKKSWWKYVLISNDLAMLAIVVHGFNLGTVLRLAWFRSVWIVFMLVLVLCIAQKYWQRIKFIKLG
jgi:hypothetical protein